MHREPFSPDTLNFAYSIHVYFRWGTHRRKEITALAALDAGQVRSLAEKYDIHLLEFSSDNRNCMALVSLKPTDAVSACASKFKGQLGKFLRQLDGVALDTPPFAHGYFATTSGKSTHAQVSTYLSRQSRHHGYEDRMVPPVYQKEFALTKAEEMRLSPQHAVACLRYHIVFSTFFRKGVFGSSFGPVVTDKWRSAEQVHRFKLLKVSFLPDHVHLAVRLHPTVSPAKLAAALMNLAQAVMWDEFKEDVIEAGLDRLFQPSAYVGGYGNLNSRAIKAYMENRKR